MEKLLHERLREWAQKDKDGIPVLNEWTHYFGGSLDCPPKDVDIWKSLADEIERYYIPRPRFEDGEPALDKDFGGNAFISVWQDGSWRLSIGGKESQCGDFSDAVKRPTPKVYDADEVEIKVGDTVWCIDDEPKRKWRVEEIHADKPLLTLYELDAIGDHSWGWVNAERFTHERPVFDAEGVRICKGETVWHITRCEKHTVEKVDGEDRAIYINDCPMAFSGVEFTHREPDSIQKVVDDMDASLRGMKVCDLQGYIDRLTALIERGA